MTENLPTAPESENNSTTARPTEREVGRNEPCPCGSGKKYKRCHGVGAAPKLSAPKIAPGAGMDAQAQNPFANMPPEVMQQVARSLQRLPKGQLQRLQAIMQRAMSGKDVSAEAAEFERTLPKEFQELMQTVNMAAMAGGMAGMPGAPAATEAPELTPEQAKELVAKAAAEGKISAEQAQELLSVPVPESVSESETDTDTDTGAGTGTDSPKKKLGGFFRGLKKS